MKTLISEDSTYADRVVACEGRRLPGDLRAACVLAFTRGGKRLHAILYHPLDIGAVREILAGASDVMVRLADSIFQEYFPELFESPA